MLSIENIPWFVVVIWALWLCFVLISWCLLLRSTKIWEFKATDFFSGMDVLEPEQDMIWALRGRAAREANEILKAKRRFGARD